MTSKIIRIPTLNHLFLILNTFPNSSYYSAKLNNLKYYSKWISDREIQLILEKQKNRKAIDELLAQFQSLPSHDLQKDNFNMMNQINVYVSIFLENLEKQSNNLHEHDTNVVHDYPYFNPFPPKLRWSNTQRESLKNVLSLRSSRETSYMIRKINISLLKKHLSYPIPKESLDQIALWLESHAFKYPKYPEFEKLRKKLRLTDMQLRFQLKSKILKLEGKKHLSEEIKSYLRQYMQDRNFELPSSIERDRLQNELNISRYQLNYYLQFLKEKKKHITPEAIENVKLWINSHPKGAKPSKIERSQLCFNNNLSSSQLSTLLIAHEKREPISNEQKDFLMAWLKENNKIPTTEERKELKKKLNWTIAQLNRYIRMYFDTQGSGKITKKIKNEFNIWIKQIPNPTISQKVEIQSKLGISRSQLNSMITNYRSKININSKSKSNSLIVSNEIKEYLALWLKENKYKLPNEEQKNFLCEKLNIQKSLLGRQIRNELSKVPLSLLKI